MTTPFEAARHIDNRLLDAEIAKAWPTEWRFGQSIADPKSRRSYMKTLRKRFKEQPHHPTNQRERGEV